jgi:hypothetical protein
MTDKQIIILFILAFALYNLIKFLLIKTIEFYKYRKLLYEVKKIKKELKTINPLGLAIMRTINNDQK